MILSTVRCSHVYEGFVDLTYCDLHGVARWSGATTGQPIWM